MDGLKRDLQAYIDAEQPDYIVMQQVLGWLWANRPGERLPRMSDFGTALKAMGYTKKFVILRRRKGDTPGLAEMRWYAPEQELEVA